MLVTLTATRVLGVGRRRDGVGIATVVRGRVADPRGREEVHAGRGRRTGARGSPEALALGDPIAVQLGVVGVGGGVAGGVGGDGLDETDLAQLIREERGI